MVYGNPLPAACQRRVVRRTPMKVLKSVRIVRFCKYLRERKESVIAKHVLRVLFFICLGLGLALVAKCVHDDVRTLCGFEDQGRLKQWLRPDAYSAVAFSRDGRDYVGIRVDSYRVGWLLRATRFFHQSAPYYVFDHCGQRIDSSRNFNDDHDFIHRWPELFPAIKSCRCGWRQETRP